MISAVILKEVPHDVYLTAKSKSVAFDAGIFTE
jgi:hypothetical protein